MLRALTASAVLRFAVFEQRRYILVSLNHLNFIQQQTALGRRVALTITIFRHTFVTLTVLYGNISDVHFSTIHVGLNTFITKILTFHYIIYI